MTAWKGASSFFFRIRAYALKQQELFEFESGATAFDRDGNEMLK